ncbi:MAG TPA: ATP-binding cassette domain-containing protein [Cyclobacteriaceae bacterium]
MIAIDIEKKLHGANGELNLQCKTQIHTGELVTLYGPSGSGKTTILRMIAGLSRPDHGYIEADNHAWFNSQNKINLKPQLRNIGMVFQEHSLFPNMTVRGNLEFALENSQPKKIIDDLLELTELEQLQHKKSSLLSGGQKQRVALARAMVRKPNLLLLDEPFSALDFEMQSKLQDYILKVHQHYNLTTILVSHDIVEVIKMSKRVLVIEDGRIKKDGLPADVLPLDNLRSILNHLQKI